MLAVVALDPKMCNDLTEHVKGVHVRINQRLQTPYKPPTTNICGAIHQQQNT